MAGWFQGVVAFFKDFNNTVVWAGYLLAICSVGTIVLFTVGGTSGQRIGLSILILAASVAVGAVAGFLFGVPKSVAVKSQEDDGGKKVIQRYQPNSNLEQVSDWLTKIIIGVGLIEIRQLAAVLGSLGVRLGQDFGDPAGKPGVGATYSLTLVVGGTLIAFLFVYMWVRTRFSEVLTQLDQPPQT